VTEYTSYTSPIGTTLYSLAIQSRVPLPILYSWSNGIHACPECSSERTGVVPCTAYWSDWFGILKHHTWYCQSCYLAWEWIQLRKCGDCGKGRKVYSKEHEGWVCDYCFYIWERGQ
jgi:hypothetical protein